MARIHTKKDLVTSIILAVSVVMISVSLDHYIGEFLRKYYYLFGAAAILLFICKGAILKKLHENVITHLLTDVIAIMFLFIFIKEAVTIYINSALISLFLGVMIFSFYPVIISAIMDGNQK